MFIHLVYLLLGTGRKKLSVLGNSGDHLGPKYTKIDQNIVSYINHQNIFENPLVRSGSKTHFSEMGLAQLDIYERHTYSIILCLHTWVFRVLLPLYFNSKEPLLVEITMGIGKISVFQESDVFGLFGEVIPGSSQEILWSL